MNKENRKSETSEVRTTSYKQTEVGLIPEDWEVGRMGNYFEFKNGLNKEKEYFGFGIPIVNYMDVYKYAGITSKEITGLVSLSKTEIKNYEVKKGDVFFTRTSETIEEIGEATVVLEELNDTVFSGFILRARPINDEIDLYFKKYCFKNKIVRKQIISTASYTTRALTNGRVLSNVLIPIPTKAEQTAIATALSDADAYIQSLETLIEKKRNIKQGAMQELLKPKEGWVVKKLGDYCEFYSGGTPSTSNSTYYGGDIMWITSSDLNMTQINEVKGRISRLGFSNSSAQMVKNGTLLVALYGATAGVTAIANIEAAINQAVLAIVPKKDDTKFLFYCLTHLKSWIISTFIQGGQGNLSGNIFKDLELAFPNISEQIQISTILSDMDNELDILENKLSKAKQLKQGMMQELLTGKIRLV